MELMHAAKSLMGHLMRPVHAGDEKLISHLAADAPPHSITLASDAFEDGGFIPPKYTQDGSNLSPPLRWANMPADTKELVLICEDPDAPKAEPFAHWIAFGLSPSTTSLLEGVPTDATISAGGYPAKQSLNSANKVGYIGPNPPIGHGPHHYHFQLFALGDPSQLCGLPDRHLIAKVMNGKVLAVGDLIGLYERT